MIRRPKLIAAVGGLVAAAAVVATAMAVAEPSEQYDGSFVLTEPGIFDEPSDEANEDSTGAQLPDVELTDADGNAVELSSYVGSPLVINLWFSTCVPCQRELVDFATVDAEVGDRVTFVGVNPFDTVDAMERFAAERGVTYDLLRDTERQLSVELGIIGYPVTLFIGTDGQILRQTGEIDAEELRAAIEELYPS